MSSLSSVTKQHLRAGLRSDLAAREIGAILEGHKGQAADAEITIGDEANNAREITIQLLDEAGKECASKQAVEIGVFADDEGDDFAATGGSTGIAKDDAGTLLAIVAKKLFKAISDATGKITLTWTDTGDEEAYIGVILPSGKLVMGGALTNVSSGA